jgi:hypothetical protein
MKEDEVLLDNRRNRRLTELTLRPGGDSSPRGRSHRRQATGIALYDILEHGNPLILRANPLRDTDSQPIPTLKYAQLFVHTNLRIVGWILF